MSTVCEASGAPTRRRGEPPAHLRDIPRRVRDQLAVVTERPGRTTDGGPLTARVDGA
jgi:hypothetical protein